MRKTISALTLTTAMVIAGMPAALAHGPTCADFGALDVENHGQHVVRDYVKGENQSAAGGAILPGGPGPGFHFANGFAPGASFCNAQSQSPGFHVPD